MVSEQEVKDYREAVNKIREQIELLPEDDVHRKMLTGRLKHKLSHLKWLELGAPNIWYSADENKWKSEDGSPVCQDHGDIMPCLFH